MSRLPKGNYLARAIPDSHDLRRSSQKGTAQSTVRFKLLGEGFVGQEISYVGYHTDATWERTVESLHLAGWTGDDLSESPLPGLGSTDVELVIDDEEYEGKTYSRVQFVNKPGGVVIGKQMDDSDKKAFAARMKQRMEAQRARGGNGAAAASGATPEGALDDIPF